MNTNENNLTEEARPVKSEQSSPTAVSVEILHRQLDAADWSIATDWKPTAENINALPAPLRKYVMDLETLCDPAGMTAKIALLTDAIDGLNFMINELQIELRNR